MKPIARRNGLIISITLTMLPFVFFGVMSTARPMAVVAVIVWLCAVASAFITYWRDSKSKGGLDD